MNGSLLINVFGMVITCSRFIGVCLVTRRVILSCVLKDFESKLYTAMQTEIIEFSNRVLHGSPKWNTLITMLSEGVILLHIYHWCGSNESPESLMGGSNEATIGFNTGGFLMGFNMVSVNNANL